MSGPFVVVGDALLDVDTSGVASRLCPDAPVPVLDDLVETSRAGGAGLAATMAARDGAEVVLVTALADDDAGRRLAERLGGVRVVPLRATTPTAVKHRIRASGQSLLRLDTGDAPGPVGPLTAEAAHVIRSAAAVLVADYGRGVTSAPGMREALGAATSRIPVTWDPHPRGPAPVPGVLLATPNRAEAVHFTATTSRRDPAACNDSGLPAVRRLAEALVAAWAAHAVAVTLGEGGALLSYGSGAPFLAPAPIGPAPDPCGAGDRFAVAAALALAAGAVPTEAVAEAVAAAAAYVHAGGPAGLPAWPERRATERPSRERPDQERPDQELTVLLGSTPRPGRQRPEVVVATGGCFDLLHAGHVATLRAARRLGDRLVVCLNSDASVRRLKGPGRPLVPAADRRRVLEAMADVDEVVVFDEDTPREVLRRIRPDIWAKGGDYAGTALPEEDVLVEWGGQAVVLPYLTGRSTTRLVRSAGEATHLVSDEATHLVSDEATHLVSDEATHLVSDEATYPRERQRT